MEQCVFCKIVSGKIDSVKIYEDGDVLAFLDVNPDTKGHSLVIPKKHFENIFDIDIKLLKKVIAVAQKIVVTIKKSLEAQGMNVVINNGKIAGQIIPHFHVHVIPRYENGELIVKPVLAELKKLSEKIKNNTRGL